MVEKGNLREKIEVSTREITNKYIYELRPEDFSAESFIDVFQNLYKAVNEYLKSLINNPASYESAKEILSYIGCAHELAGESLNRRFLDYFYKLV